MAADRQNQPDTLRGTLLAFACVVALSSAPIAQAMTADEAFADGNRLFRDDLYWAALLRYQQAADAGMSSPLLDYNIGVAHYKARQYLRAREYLMKAARSPALSLISQYNLGLTAYANGEDAEALRWFRTTRDQDQNRRIRRLSNRAIERIRDERINPVAEVEPVEVADVEEEELRELDRDPREFAEIDFFARAGFGSDDNVYRTPSESYLDISDPTQSVQVNPVVQTGSFVPVSIAAQYTVNSFEHESFFARYRGVGRFYSDELLTNADEHTQEIAIGTEYRKDRENRSNRVFSAFTVAQHDETYFDPDDGLARAANATDIGDRLSYLRYGPEIWTRQSWERFSFNAWFKAQLWNYENTREVPEYDHEFFKVGTSVQYRFTTTSLLRLRAETYRRYFTDRPAFELDGTQPLGNVSVEYRYVDYSILARQRLTRDFYFGVSYTRTERVDAYLGYNDYFRDAYGAELRLRIGDRFELTADGQYRIYNYSNAFAFNNAAAPRKTLETADGTLKASFAMPWNLRLVGEYEYRDVLSNDTRIDYERSLFLLSLQWDYE